MAFLDDCIPLMDADCGAIPYPGLYRSPSEDLLLESIAVDGEGNVFSTFLTNTPVTTGRSRRQKLAKGCEPQFALEKCGTLLLSKPERFRREGESLIWDMQEGVAQNEDHFNTRINDPADVAALRSVDDQRILSEEAKFMREKEVWESVEFSGSAHRTDIGGENCLIWCAAIAPSSKAEEARWKQALTDSYGYVWPIYDPCIFARAMAVMAFRAGVRGNDIVFRHPLTGNVTSHPNLSVVHGPVEYMEDTSGYVFAALTDAGKLARSAFAKHIAYAGQQEYRFVILARHEIEDLTLLLDVSPMMRKATRRRRDTGRIAPSTRASNSRRALMGNPLLREWDARDVERLRQGTPSLKVKADFTIKGTQKDRITVTRTISGTVPGVTEEDLDRAISEMPTTSQDARLAKVAWNTVEGESKFWFSPGGLPETGRYEINSKQITLAATPINPKATVTIDPPDAFPDLPSHQVKLPTGTDTRIEFVTTSEDGTTTSTCTLIAVRS